MKKKYLQPQAREYAVVSDTLLAASLDAKSSGATFEQNSKAGSGLDFSDEE